MNAVTTFDSTKEALQDMLRDVMRGGTQLPDFQRGWVWDDDHIRSLIASISLSYPIGTVMMLESGNPDVRFKPRLVEGVNLALQPEPERFILDGQQRLTSLFQALLSGKPVMTWDARKLSIKRWYYIDINKALDPLFDREDAVVGLPENRQNRNFRGEVIADYSEPDSEYAAELFPLSQLFDCSDWRQKHNAYWKYDPQKVKLFDEFEKEIIKRFEQYQMPLIMLRKPTPKEAVCQVFEKVNTGGVSLTVFELLTATFAVDDFNLREDWVECERRLHRHKVLKSIESTDFLQTITLLATFARKRQNQEAAVSCKRKDVLRLTLQEYRQWADAALKGYENAARLLHGQKIFDYRDLPYRTQLIPLAAILAALGDQADNDGVRAKLSQWYWCGVFGELYGSAIETRFAKDLPEVVAWVEAGTPPSTIADANFAPTRILTLRTRNSAAYKGLSALLIRDGGLDFRTGDPIDVQMYFDERIDIHHIFPRGYCEPRKLDRKQWDCIVNKTPLSAKTNRMIGANAPSVYLERLQKNAGIVPERMNKILASHVVDPTLLRADDFNSFFTARQRVLLDRIESAMGKPMARDAIEPNSEDLSSNAGEEDTDEAEK